MINHKAGAWGNKLSGTHWALMRRWHGTDTFVLVVLVALLDELAIARVQRVSGSPQRAARARGAAGVVPFRSNPPPGWQIFPHPVLHARDSLAAA